MRREVGEILRDVAIAQAQLAAEIATDRPRRWNAVLDEVLAGPPLGMDDLRRVCFGHHIDDVAGVYRELQRLWEYWAAPAAVGGCAPVAAARRVWIPDGVGTVFHHPCVMLRPPLSAMLRPDYQPPFPGDDIVRILLHWIVLPTSGGWYDTYWFGVCSLCGTYAQSVILPMPIARPA